MTKSLRLKAMLIALIVLLSLALIVASYLIAKGNMREKHHLHCTYSSCSFRDNYSVRANRPMSL